jgi:ankyrin repeat protein
MPSVKGTSPLKMPFPCPARGNISVEEDASDNTGETPLSSAVRSGNKKIVEMLIKAGAKSEMDAS